MKSTRRSHLRRIRRVVVGLACFAALLALPTGAPARVLPPDPPAPHIGAPAGLSSPSQSPVTVVKKDDGRTLAIVLASCALGVSLCAAGYAVVRTRGPRSIEPGAAA